MNYESPSAAWGNDQHVMDCREIAGLPEGVAARSARADRDRVTVKPRRFNVEEAYDPLVAHGSSHNRNGLAIRAGTHGQTTTVGCTDCATDRLESVDCRYIIRRW